ncbi:DUF2268 domain-containing putative Zn-dependent protease [Flagellimonas pacifica]|uniref:Predicted Zn-dependent protease n=1 Tax=Flagellimonas pacifica TaxID=1247520 RepID=A0A285MQK4_9FLAO|nr:DUF2268 domain-containing putative Zn-dependent protease [Allomuricauda parva]SNY99464.1 Predicted Zn-dependent protease [Allomuricauda parva]
MKNILWILNIGVFLFLMSCKETKKVSVNSDIEFIEKIKKISDSVKVEGIVIKNLFKSQILAHHGTEYDSMMIIEKVYRPHQKLWDNCYGMIFGEENSSKFNTTKGMVEWNQTLYPENKSFFDQRAEMLINMNIDSILKKNLTRFNELVPHKTEATISILFTPMLGILFGGCENDQFCIELNYEVEDMGYIVEKAIPHELNHLAYEPLRENDPDRKTALSQTIDEGFACYFTWLFFNGQIAKHEAIENMSKTDWDWYLANEKKLYNELKPYFADESGENPLLRNDKIQLFKDAPKSLNYWLGFRIIEKYVENNGVDSWKDIYEKDVNRVLKESKYEDFINTLN